MRKIILTVILTTFVFIAGFSFGKQYKELPCRYLPKKYSEIYKPTLAELKNLELMIAGIYKPILVGWKSAELKRLELMEAGMFKLTLAEWKSLKLMAAGNYKDNLTEKLINCSFETLPFPDYFYVNVDTKCQPDWNVFLENGRFNVSDREIRAAYSEAGDMIIKIVKTSLPDIDKKYIKIYFFIQGEGVGRYTNGKMLLVGEY